MYCHVLSCTVMYCVQEVCGLTWSPDGKYLASGGNDNTVQLWDPAAGPRTIKSITEHLSAVKAVSWCPWQAGVLATAGGTVDRTIRSIVLFFTPFESFLFNPTNL